MNDFKWRQMLKDAQVVGNDSAKQLSTMDASKIFKSVNARRDLLEKVRAAPRTTGVWLCTAKGTVLSVARSLLDVHREWRVAKRARPRSVTTELPTTPSTKRPLA
jgi:hypothetical protein